MSKSATTRITESDRRVAYGKYLNAEQKNAAREELPSGGWKGGKIKLDKQPTLDELCKECVRVAKQRIKDVAKSEGREPTADELVVKASETSVRQGIVKDFAKYFAGSTIVRVDKKEMSALAWFDEQAKVNKKLKLENIVTIVDGAAKSDKLKIVRRGTEAEMATCLAGGNRGRAKSDPMADLMDF